LRASQALQHVTGGYASPKLPKANQACKCVYCADNQVRIDDSKLSRECQSFRYGKLLDRDTGAYGNRRDKHGTAQHPTNGRKPSPRCVQATWPRGGNRPESQFLPLFGMRHH